jgi:hypothetical protein
VHTKLTLLSVSLRTFLVYLVLFKFGSAIVRVKGGVRRSASCRLVDITPLKRVSSASAKESCLYVMVLSV